jgi:AcrR family transcriptional regulator
MKVPRSTDKRVLRTRAILRDALVSLIIERGWDATSIQDVCDRAEVGRSTFYTHFADKEDLLLAGFDDLRSMLKEAARSNELAGRPFGFTRPLLEHAAENQRLFRALVGKRSGQTVQRRFFELVVHLTRDELATTMGTGSRLDATVQYVTGALVQLVMWWVDMRKPMAAAELDAIFLRLTRPVLAAAREAR